MAHQSPLDQHQPAPGPGQEPAQEQKHQELSQDPYPDTIHSPTTKIYDIYYTTSRTNAKLHLRSTSSSHQSSSGPCLYCMESVLLTASKPQIQLRRGDSKSAPMVACARIQKTSRHVLLGCGDYEKGAEGNLVWEEMRREHNVLRRSDYEFGTSIGSSSGPRRTYSWQRDRGKWAKTVYECVNDAGQVVAGLLSGGMFNWRKGGEIRVASGLDTKLEEILLLSALVVWVKEAGWSYRKGYGVGHEYKPALARTVIEDGDEIIYRPSARARSTEPTGQRLSSNE